MHKQFNRRLLGKSLAVLLSAGILIFLLHSWQISRSAEELLVESKKAAERKDYRRSLLYLRHYLELNPDDLKARLDYALVIYHGAETSSNRWRAYRLLHSIVQKDPNAIEARNYLALVAVQLKRYDEAIQHLELLRGKTKDPAELEHTLGWCYVAAHRPEDARIAFEKAIKKAPHDVKHYVQLAKLWDNQDEREQAGVVLNQMVEANPELADAWLERGKMRRQWNQPGLAGQDLLKAARLAPDNLQINLLAADLARQNDHPDEARELFDGIIQAHPKKESVYLLASRLERDRSQNGAAISILRQGLTHVPESTLLNALLGDLLLKEKQIPEAKAHFDRLPEISSLWQVWAQGHLAQAARHWAQAARHLEHFNATMQASFWTGEAELALAECYRNSGDLTREIEALRRALQVDPWSLHTLRHLGTALQKDGRLQDSLVIWQRLTGRSGATSRDWLHRAQVSIALQASTRSADQSWGEAEKALQQAAKDKSLVIDTALTQAELRYAQGRDEDGGQILSDLLQLNTGEVRAWVAYADGWVRSEQWGTAKQVLNQARDILGDQSVLRLGQVQVVLSQPTVSPNDLNELLKLTSGLAKFSPEEQGSILGALSRVAVRAGDYEEARRQCSQWGKVQPERLEPWVALHGLTSSTPDSPLHKEAIEKIRAIEGERGLRWRFASSLRWMAVARKNNDERALNEAKKILDQAEKLQPQHTRALILRGQVAELEGDVDLAIAHYLKVFKAKDYHPATMERLVRLLMKKKRFVEAEQVYAQTEDRLPATREVARLGTELALQMGKGPEAAQRVKLAVPENAPDYRDHLWRVKVQRELGNQFEALRILEHLSREQSEVPDVWIALAEQLAIMDRGDDARKLVEELSGKVRPRDLTLTQARAYWALGDEATAEKRFLQVWKERGEDPFIAHWLAQFYLHFERWAQAEQFLVEITKHPLQLPGDRVRWAKRELAFIEADYYRVIRKKLLTVSESDQHTRESRALKWLNGKGKQDQLHQIRARLLIESLLPSRRKQALARWSEKAEENVMALTSEEQLALAYLYQSLGETEKAKALVLSLLEKDPRNGRYLATMVRFHRDVKQNAGAEFWLSRLRQIEPTSARTRALVRKFSQSAG